MRSTNMLLKAAAFGISRVIKLKIVPKCTGPRNTDEKKDGAVPWTQIYLQNLGKRRQIK